MDTLTPQARSKTMGLVKAKNTKPEMRVPKLLHSRGLRYTLHKNILPGKPDIVFSRFKTVVFVHGCFWHRHEGCGKTRTPKSNIIFWIKKFEANIVRDRLITEAYQNMGWHVFTIWECQTGSDKQLRAVVDEYVLFLGSINFPQEIPL